MTRLVHALLALCLIPAMATAQALRPPEPAEVAERFLGPAANYGAPGHVIVLVPRTAPGAATDLGEAIADRHEAVLEASWPLPSLEETCFVLRLPPDVDPAEAAADVMAEEGVLLAYPIQTFEVRQAVSTDATAEDAGVDPLVVAQNALRTMRIADAQSIVTGRGVSIALIDSGVAMQHPDLVGRAVEAYDFVGDGQGEVERHGTALATLIAADPSNGVGMAGIAPDATLLALRACREDGVAGVGQCNTFSLALALDHAIVTEVDIINLSIGGPPDRLLAALVGRAQEGGAVVVAADGDTEFPSRLPGVVAVGRSDAASGAIQAPGFEVLAAEPSGGYDFFTGSSVSAAHAAGVAALLWSGTREADATQVREALGSGHLDACKALDMMAGDPRCP